MRVELSCGNEQGKSVAPRSAPLPLDRFIEVAVDAARSMAELHVQGAVIGTISAANLLPFAHSDRIPDSEDSISGDDLAYIAPERLRETEPRPSDQRSDLYSLGVALYEQLTGRLPFDAKGSAEWRHAHLAIQPPAPGRWRNDVPAVLDAILLRLLAKDPADRYLSAEALHTDLLACKSALLRDGTMPWFEPGAAEGPLRIGKDGALFGRENEIQLIGDVIRRVCTIGRGEIVLVSGVGGIGKTALIQGAIAATAASFASGKSDKLQRDNPYAAVTQVLKVLFNRSLSDSDSEIAEARSSLLKRLDGHGRLIVDLVPEAEHVLGPTAPLVDVPPHIGLMRTQNAILHTLDFFAGTDRPLVLFLDDLQWADTLTLAVLEALIAHAPAHICFIGAFRDREADVSTEPSTLVKAARSGRMPLTEIALAPLSPESTADLVAAAMPGEVSDVAPLIQMVFQRTSGNPFFVNQLLRSLFEGKAIRHDALYRQWFWVGAEVTQLPYSEDVAAFMAARLGELPHSRRELLRQMACIGREAPLSLLCAMTRTDVAELRVLARQLVEAGLLQQSAAGYIFSHDRVFEAAYALSEPEQRADDHRQIARLMIAQESQSGSEYIFEIANQIERANLEPLSPDDRIAFVNVLAAAATSARYTGGVAQACRYLQIAIRLMDDSWWTDNGALAFKIYLLHAEMLLATAATIEAANTIDLLLTRAQSSLDHAAARRLEANLLTLRSDYDGAIGAALLGLDALGIHLQRGASRTQLDLAYANVKSALGDRPIATLGNLPVMTDPAMQSAMALLSTLISSIFTPDGLRFLHMAKMVELTLKHGTTQDSAYGLSWFGVMIASLYEDYKDGYEYGQAALALVERHGYDAQRTATLVAVDQVSAWTRPLSYSLNQIREAIRTGHAAGDVGMTCYARNHLISDLLVMGAPLDRIESELVPAIAMTQQLGYRDIELLIQGQQHLVQTLRAKDIGGTALRGADDIVATSTRFWVRLYQGVAHYWSGEAAAALTPLSEASNLIPLMAAHIDTAWCSLFLALTVAAIADDDSTRAEAIQRLAPARAQFARWASLNRMTFQNKLLLVDAELARLSGDATAALALYEQAAVAAQDAGFVHEQALAHELAGGHLRRIGIQPAAQRHFQLAHDLYAGWGATAKAARMTAEHGLARPIATSELPASVDLAVVLRTSQAISEEIVLDTLVRSLVRDLIIHAGADRGTLITMRDGEPSVEAVGTVLNGEVAVSRETSETTAQAIPSTILNTVRTTRKALLLADARVDLQGLHASDIGTRAARSILCVPLIRRGDLTGLVYLENQLAGGVFTPDRIAIIEMLASQAAISLENARLYAELMQQNQRRATSEAALRTARAKLARTSQLTTLGGLAASIAHEVNQPLSAIASHADATRRWLDRPNPDLAHALHGVDSIRAGVGRVTEIIRALRAIARQTSHSMTPMSVDPMISQVLHLTATETESREIVVATKLQAGDVIINGDRTQLEQVLLNLVTNAADALVAIPPGKRRLQVTTSVESGMVVVCVIDNGHGIPAAISTTIFEPLVTTKETGMGMGLAICRSIIEAHGGKLEARSDENGTTFSFALPMVTRASSPPAGPVAQEDDTKIQP